MRSRGALTVRLVAGDRCLPVLRLRHAAQLALLGHLIVPVPAAPELHP